MARLWRLALRVEQLEYAARRLLDQVNAPLVVRVLDLDTGDALLGIDLLLHL